MGTDLVSSQDQVQCLTKWVDEGAGNGRAFSVGEDVLNVRINISSTTVKPLIRPGKVDFLFLITTPAPP